LDAHSDPPLREVAVAVGITERSASKIISELVEAGYLSRERVGRRNHYTVNTEVPLRHSELTGHSVGELLSGLDPKLRNTSRGNGGRRTRRHGLLS
jgi:hypothetical protein